MQALGTMPHLLASPVLAEQAIVTFAGKDVAISLNGMIPSEVADVTTIRNYIIAGSLDELIAHPEGIVRRDGLVKKLSLSVGENLALTTPTGEVCTFKIRGIFHAGRDT